ncbi:hypothetical protein [Methylobacterium sp. GC_Met_2]|uniref:hypothetical protein n=1 Tax=Methylobacterium sp. GC_Met_2 TaxID=2937376 RepID=UPI00226B202E|nr:hypothetical protein [Methylobacterium sp. GC_Met_2]
MRDVKSDPWSDLPKCFGPYLRYAIVTRFRDFALLHSRTHKLFLLVAFKRAGSASAFVKAMGRDASVDVELGPDSAQRCFATVFTTLEGVTTPPTAAIWDAFVDQVELSLPIKRAAVTRRQHRVHHRHHRAPHTPPGPVLIGLLDDGCPFAAAQFLRGPASTRVRGIWDQDRGKSPISFPDNQGNLLQFGMIPADFLYGVEFRRAPLPPSAPTGLDLNAWIALHAGSGSIDEDGCYADADFRRLLLRQSHGAHVMDVLAGIMPTASRVGPTGPGTDNRDPPSWQDGTDPASSADIVFVQFSEDCIKDATGVWLKAYIFDGIRYVLSYVDPDHTEHVIINISYGITTGPHNGTSELERALAAFVADFNGTPGKPRLEIVLPAGNSDLSDSHVCHVGGPEPGDICEWVWRLLPDNPVTCFAEIWMPGSAAQIVTITLTAPSGASASSAAVPPPGAPAAAFQVSSPIVQGTDTLWLLAVQATQDAAEHGDWRITVSGIPRGAEMHAYAARSDPNIGVRTGAKRSYFVDDAWRLATSAEADLTYVDGAFDDAGSLIRRDGTLNGIATAGDSNVHVAGGYILANGRRAAYSSAGPARPGPLTLRAGPDFLLPTDGTFALKGLRAGGNRTGSVFRLIGTSTASPQLARQLTNPPLPAPTQVPTTPGEIAKRGGGNLKPA